MKKILALFVGFAVLATSTAFGLDLPDALKLDGLSVSGDIKTGLRVTGATHDKGSENLPAATNPNFPGAGAENPKAFAYSDDVDDGTPFRADLVLEYDRDNFGLKTGFRYDGDSRLGDAAPSQLGFINSAFVWGTVLDKKVKVFAGKGFDGTWGLFWSDFGDGATDSFDGKDGVKVEVTPIEGLNVGAFYGAGDLFANAVSDYPGDSELFDRRLVVGAKYDHSAFGVVLSMYHNFADLATPESGIRNYETWEYDRRKDYWDDLGGSSFVGIDPMGATVDNALPNTTNLLIGFQLKPTDNLPLQIDLSMAITGLGSMTVKKNIFDGDVPDTTPAGGVYKKGDFNPYWGLQPKIRAIYGINDKFSLEVALTDLQFADWYYYETSKDTTVSSSNPNPDYENNGRGHLFPITINLTPGYKITDDLGLSAELSFKINAGGSDQFGFGFKPKAEFSLGDGAKFVVYDNIVFWGQSAWTKDDPADFQEDHAGVGDILKNYGAAGTENTLQFDFVWEF
jgi:hypothetical protein